MRLAALVAASLAGIGSAAAAECTQPDSPIETDRPDATNSSVVVPVGSLQNENGIDTSGDHGATILNGANSRWRLGIAPCLEVLVDLPTYVTTLRGAGPSGFSDVAPAVKWQISPLPGKFDLSITAGAALPTGATAVTGPGKEFAERSFLFVEYVGNFPSNGRNSKLINSGGGYRIDDHHQIDFHVGVGLDRNAPDYIFGVCYSFRLDGFLQRDRAATRSREAAPKLDLVTK